MYEWSDLQVHGDFQLAIQIGPAGVRTIAGGGGTGGRSRGGSGIVDMRCEPSAITPGIAATL